MNQNRKFICGFLLTSLLLLPFFHGCGKGGGARDKALEGVLSKKLTEFRHGDEESLDLRTVLSDPWEMICIQGPYQPQAVFEKAIGRKVDGFEEVDDGYFVFWVFDGKGQGRRARIHRHQVMDRYLKKGSICTKFDNPYLFARNDKGERKYYFYSTKH